MVTRMFWYRDFEDRSLRAGEKTIGLEIMSATGSTNGGAEGKHRTRGSRGWMWCYGLENGE